MTTVAPREATWFTYFPDNYRWSSAFCSILSSAPYGGGDIGEADRAGRRLRGRVGDDEAWFSEFTALGDRVRKLAEAHDARGKRFTASAAYLRACSYYQMAERFRTPKDERALFEAVGSQDKTFRVFTVEEGGAQHCQRDYLTLGTQTIFDWFEDKL